MILFYILFYFILLYFIILYYIMLCYVMLCYIILYYIMLYYIILYYIILYYIILYYIILYYMPLYNIFYIAYIYSWSTGTRGGQLLLMTIVDGKEKALKTLCDLDAPVVGIHRAARALKVL